MAICRPERTDVGRDISALIDVVANGVVPIRPGRLLCSCMSFFPRTCTHFPTSAAVFRPATGRGALSGVWLFAPIFTRVDTAAPSGTVRAGIETHGQSWSMSGHTWPKSGHTRPKFVDSGPNVSDFG